VVKKVNLHENQITVKKKVAINVLMQRRTRFTIETWSTRFTIVYCK